MNSNDGSIIANAAIVPAGSPNGSIRVLSRGNTDFIIDVNWRKCIYGAMGVLSSKDQTDAIVALANERSWIDRGRIAVWGWSGGGTNTEPHVPIAGRVQSRRLRRSGS